jgi:hypothetical protein
MAKNAPQEQFGRQYAAGLAATLDPRLATLRAQYGAYKTPEQIAAEVSGLYQPGIARAGQIGEDVAKVGQVGLAAAAGLASALPNFDVTALADAARSTGRAGGTAAITGSVMENQARAALAQSILSEQGRASEQRMQVEREIAGAEEEKAKIAADWMSPAMQRQQMATTASQNELLRAELKNVPIARRAARLQNLILRGQIRGINLENAATVAELRKLGLSNKQIKSLQSAGAVGAGSPESADI